VLLLTRCPHQLNARDQVELVLAVIEQRWARSADPSQVRYFIFKVRVQH
jgi:hypothetical protein